MPLPRIVEPLKEKTAVKGDEKVTLECVASEENVESTWFRDDFEILPDDKYKLRAEGAKHELTIHDVTLEDEGEYTVEIGEDASSAMLWVEGRFTQFQIVQLLSRTLTLA